MLKIVKYPDPILTQPNEEVKFPLTPEVKNLIGEMWLTVKGLGIGLAAPQVGKNIRLCIIHMGKDEKGKKNIHDDFVMINPEIVFYSKTENLITEGCLSFPGEFYEIWRPQGIKVKYYDEKGRLREKTASGLLARVIQHEVDHLNGRLFINLGGKKIKEDEVDRENLVD